jgi:aspartyl-tRNA(Asn)/glutamyl-tRNA(Gln) amidotransferase subunit A
LANSVEDCAIVDAVFAGEPIAIPDAAPLAGLRFGIPKQFVMDELDPTVAKAFDRACKALSAKGVIIEQVDLPQLLELPAINAKGGFAASEAYAWHHKLIARRGNAYDPFVHTRILRGKEMSAADYIELLAARADLQKRASAVTSNYDAIVMPTCAIVAPTIEEVSTSEGFVKKNLLLLRNTTVGNFLDRCGISLPCHAAGELPVGFMLMGEAMADRRVLAMARSVAPVVHG